MILVRNRAAGLKELYRMRHFFLFILIIHGFIHIHGLSKGYAGGLAAPAKAVIFSFGHTGIWWLAAFLLFILSAVIFFYNNTLWWLPAIAAVFLSQVLIVLFWKDAKWGTIANLIILLVAIAALAEWNFTRAVNREINALLASVKVDHNQRITPEMLNGLPAPVRLWLNNSGVVGKEVPQTVRLKQKGMMCTQPGQSKWMEAKAEQYFTVVEPAFIWRVKMNMMPLLPVSGRDKWIEGKGRMNIKLFSLYNIVSQADEKIDRGALQRWLAEMVWFPAAAVSAYIKWEEIDALSAKATLSYKGVSGSVVFLFNEKGDAVGCRADRYMGGGKDAALQKWEVHSTAFAVLNGIRIPVRSEATWKLKTGDFTWYKLEITDVEYNRPFLYN